MILFSLSIVLPHFCKILFARPEKGVTLVFRENQIEKESFYESTPTGLL